MARDRLTPLIRTTQCIPRIGLPIASTAQHPHARELSTASFLSVPTDSELSPTLDDPAPCQRIVLLLCLKTCKIYTSESE